MKCPYHNTPDIYENYLLQRLTDGEKRNFEQHLPDCDHCREELSREQTIIQGIREIGSREMKREIQQQVSQLKKGPIWDWGVYLKIAAAILFFVVAPGMIYYYQHFTPRPQMPGELMSIKQEGAIELGAEKKMEREEIPAAVSPAEKMTKSQLPSAKGKEQPTAPIRQRDDALATNQGVAGASSTDEAAVLSESVLPSAAETDAIFNGEAAAGRRLSVAKPAEPEAGDKAGHQILFTYDSIQVGQDFRTKSDHSYYSRISDSRGGKEWQFSSAYRQIIILITESPQKLTLDKKTQLPAQFSSKVLPGRPDIIQLLWEVNPEFQRLDPSRFQVLLENDTTLIVQVSPASYYQFNLRDSVAMPQLQSWPPR